MTEIRIRVDSKELELQLAQLSGSEARAAMSRSLNRAIRSTSSLANRLIREEINIRAGAVRKALSVRRARPGSLSAEINVAAKAAPLIAFKGTRQIKAGVSVKPKKKRTVIKGAFVATMRSGHKGVFVRESVGGHRAARLPIRELFSTAPAQALDDEQKRLLLGRHARDRFETEIGREIEFRLTR